MTLEEAHYVQATTCNTSEEWREPDPRWIEATNIIRAARGLPPWQPETPDPGLVAEFEKKKKARE